VFDLRKPGKAGNHEVVALDSRREGKQSIERGKKVRGMKRTEFRRGEVESLTQHQTVGSMWVDKLVSCNTHVQYSCTLLLGQTQKNAAGSVWVTITS
jgi:hypothetical protein